MKAKSWHIVVIAVGLLVGLGSLVYQLVSGEPDVVVHQIHCVDVETGDLYRIDTKKTRVILPARHPQTGRICLVRVTKDEHGKWFVKSKDLQTLTMLDEGVKNNFVDASSGDLTAEMKAAVDYARKN